MVYFVDEQTPLPDPAVPGPDVLFPTGRIPRIDLSDELDDEPAGAALYPRWRLRSPCASIEEFARLHAPYVEDSTLFLFVPDVREVGERAALELVLRGGRRAFAGVVEVIQSVPASPGVRPGMRLRLVSADPGSEPLLAALGEHAGPRGTGKVPGLAAPPPAAGSAAAAPVPVPVRDDATIRMSRLEIADLMDADDDEVSDWSDLLQCRLAVTTSGECAVASAPTRPNETCRTVIADLTGPLDTAPAPAFPAPTRAAAAPTRAAVPGPDAPATCWWWAAGPRLLAGIAGLAVAAAIALALAGG